MNPLPYPSWPGLYLDSSRPLPTFLTQPKAYALGLMILGTPQREAALEMGITRSRLDHLLQDLREAVGCNSTAQLVWHALHRGWFKIDPVPFERAREAA